MHIRTSNYDLGHGYKKRVGRYTRPKTPLLDRICLSIIQDITARFVLTHYTSKRNKSNNDKFQFLMKRTDKTLIKYVTQFIFMAFKQRTTNT